MKKLYLKTTTWINGFDGEPIYGYSYTANILPPIDDAPITQEEVVEADVVAMSYETFEEIGDITEEELNVLRKFSIL